MNFERFPFNVRLLAIIVGACIGLVIVLVIIHRFQVGGQSQFFLEQARIAGTAADELTDLDDRTDEIRKAMSKYAKYLRYNPDDQEVRAEFGEMLVRFGEKLAKEGRGREAGPYYLGGVDLLEQVLRFEPERQELRRTLAQSLFSVGRAKTALDHLKYLAAVPPGRDGLEKLFDRYNLWMRTRSQNETRDGDWRDAILQEFLTQEGNVDRQKVVAWLGDDLWMILEEARLLKLFALCQIQLGVNSPAEKSLEKAVRLAADKGRPDLELYEILARMLQKAGRATDADFWISETVNQYPDSIDANRIRGQFRIDLVRRTRKDAAAVLTREATWDALESLRKTIERVADKADSTAPSATTTRQLKKAFNDALAARSRQKHVVNSAYREALIQAAEIIFSLDEEALDTEKERQAICRALVLAAQAELVAAGLDGPDPTNPHLECALQYGEAAQQLAPDYAPPYSVLSDIERARGDAEKAISWLRKGKEFEDYRLVISWKLADLLIGAGRAEEGKEAIRELAKMGAPARYLAQLKAILAYREKDWRSAKSGFETALPYFDAQPEVAFRLNLGIAKCCEELGLVDQQRQALENAAKLDWTSVQTLLDLARIEEESGQLDEAIEDYRRVLGLPNASNQTHLSLTRCLLAKTSRMPKLERNWLEVDSAFDAASEALPDSLQIPLLQADILIAKDKPKKAAELVAKTQERARKQIVDLASRRERAIQGLESLAGNAKQDRLAELRRLDSQVSSLQQVRTSSWRALVRLAEREKDWGRVDSLLEAGESAFGDTPRTRAMKARHYLKRFGEKAAPKIRELLKDSDRFSPEQRMFLWSSLAPMAKEAGDLETAKRLCNQVLEHDPQNQRMCRLQFVIAMTETNLGGMEEALKRLREVESKPDAFWHYGQACRLVMLVEEGGSDGLLRKALKELDTAQKLAPTWSEVPVMKGQVLQRQGRVDKAATEYLKGIELGNSNPELVRRAAQILLSTNRLREADRMFRLLAERDSVLSAETERQSLSVKSQLGEFEDALGPARELAAKSEEAEDLIWLGQLLTVLGRRMQSQGQTDDATPLLLEAEDALRKAVIKKLDAPESWIALIQFYAQTDQPEKAEHAIKRARVKLTAADAAAVLGQCYEVLNQPEKAAEQIEIALQTAPRDPLVAWRAATFYRRAKHLDKAEEQLMRIIRGEVDATRGLETRARYEIASLLSQQGGSENRREAIKWIDKNLEQQPASIRDQRLKALILASDATGKHRREAIALLERLSADEHNLDPYVRLNLAQLYRSDNNWRQYHLLMRKLLETHGEDPWCVAEYVSGLTRSEEFGEAAIWAAQLAKIAPHDFQTTSLLAELAFRQEEYDRAKKILVDYLGKSEESDSSKEDDILSVANGLEHYGGRLRAAGKAVEADSFSQEAHQLYRRFVNARPGRDILMATFLAKQQRLDEAINLVESLSLSVKPSETAKACFAIIDGAGPSPQQVDRVDQILQRTAQQYPDALGIKIATAVLRSWQDRFQDAEAIYRDILRETPDNPTALNNLAVLLARHGVKLDEAAELIDRAIEQTKGPTPSLLDSRAVVQLALRHPEKALDDLQMAIAKDPKPMRFFHQAEAFHQLGKRKLAVESFKEATRLGLREEHLSGVELRKFRTLRHTLD